MSPIAGCQAAGQQVGSSQQEQLHFTATDQGKLLTCGSNRSTICLKATLCFLGNGRRPKHTHSSFYDYKVSILLMALSLIVCCFACSISWLSPPFLSLALLSASLASTLLLPSFLTTTSCPALLHLLHLWFSPPFGLVVRFL